MNDDGGRRESGSGRGESGAGSGDEAGAAGEDAEEEDLEVGNNNGNDASAAAMVYDDEDEDESLRVLIPKPGLFLNEQLQPQDPPDGVEQPLRQQQPQPEPAMRDAPANCTICLCNYRVGDEVVWSSNSGKCLRKVCSSVFSLLTPALE